ncbi:expressed unknown protein [Seminavis robusta]|uniref:Uncharacterized protein n=1 Tax=Seminavis robusta TaxID=568900 RepID=A0A9N8DB09_9STRA|nr:expressed unknown protein [Seminavis robusta]|eukprot:Sro64_g036200.1 n/a (254) ;mRNA; r:38849-39610
MSLPTYVLLSGEDDDGVNSVVTFLEEDPNRWEKLVVQSCPSQANCLPKHPKRRISIQQQEIHGSVGLPSVPTRRESIVLEEELEPRPRRRATVFRTIDVDLAELKALADQLDMEELLENEEDDETMGSGLVLAPPTRRESICFEDLDASAVSYCSHSVAPSLSFVVQEHAVGEGGMTLSRSNEDGDCRCNDALPPRLPRRKNSIVLKDNSAICPYHASPKRVNSTFIDADALAYPIIAFTRRAAPRYISSRSA